jgi:hypothetical protein
MGLCASRSPHLSRRLANEEKVRAPWTPGTGTTWGLDRQKVGLAAGARWTKKEKKEKKEALGGPAAPSYSTDPPARPRTVSHT